MSSLQLQILNETLTQTNTHLAELVSIGQGTLGFFQKWVPWIVAAAGLLWPAVGKVISGLPPLPG